MRFSHHRWLAVPLVAAAVVVAVMAAGHALEHLAFRGFAHGVANPPMFIEDGRPGSTEAFRLRTPLSHAARPSGPADLMVVALEDDAEGLFQEFPHAAVDLALIMRNMERHGAKSAAIGATLAWEAPDTIGLITLNNALDRFETVITSVPLTRAAAAEPLPAAFRRASLDPAVVHGPHVALPVVNRPAVANAILGNDNALAGFTSIEPSDAPSRPPLLARWDDRVVLAFPLLAALQQLGKTPEDLEIHIGSHIRIGGAGGMIVPIDGGGRLAVDAAPAEAVRRLAAGMFFEPGFSLDDETGELPEAWLLRDDRGILDRAFRSHSRELVPVVATITQEAGLGEPGVFHRPPGKVTVVLLGGWIVLLTALKRIGGFAMDVGFVLAVAGMALLQWLAFSLANIWFPGVPALTALAVVWPIAKITADPQAVGKAIPSPAAPSPPIPEPVVRTQQLDKKPATTKKAAATTATAKKTPAKKAAAKKTPARKAATKKARPRKRRSG